MSRTTNDEYEGSRLVNGYDYTKQSWVRDGKYIRCGHPDTMNCKCYGKINQGKAYQVHEGCIWSATR